MITQEMADQEKTYYMEELKMISGISSKNHYGNKIKHVNANSA